MPRISINKNERLISPMETEAFHSTYYIKNIIMLCRKNVVSFSVKEMLHMLALNFKGFQLCKYTCVREKRDASQISCFVVLLITCRRRNEVSYTLTHRIR
jgi:hypothetical protein